jgi:signal transduction histidine kinase
MLAGTMTFGRLERSAVAALVTCFLLGIPCPAPAQSPASTETPATAAPGTPAPTRRVLLLYTESRLTPAIVDVDTAIRASLASRSPFAISFYTEYLDLTLFDRNAPVPELRELLRRKYETRPLDLIIAAGSSALRVAVHNRADLFSNAPIVFTAVDRTAAADIRIDDDVTGTWLHMPWTETLGLARRLQPDLRRVLVVTGAAPPDRVWMAEARKQLAALEDTIEITYRSGPPLPQIVDEVRRLPARSAVILGAMLRDGAGRELLTAEAGRQIAAAASAPVFVLTPAAIGSGVVGGQVVSFEAHGHAAAELGARALAGERPPPEGLATTVPTFDARQLSRLGLDASRLPPDSRVLFDEPTLWQRYRWYLIGAAGVLLVQTALIGSLLVQRAQRRRAQERLAERLRFETLLSELAGILGASSPDDADVRVQTALRRMVEALDVEWATARSLESDGAELWLTHSWTGPNVPPRPAVVREAEVPWLFACLREGRIVRVAGPASLPDEATVDRRSLADLGARSFVLTPLLRDGAVVGSLALGAESVGPRWPDESTPRLQLLAELFGSALERQRAVRADRESQQAIRDLAGRLITAQEEERRRIARDLHDGVNQELAAHSIALSTLGDRLPGDTTPAVRQEVTRLQASTVELANVIRDLSHSLHPGVLHHVGLVPALRGYCREFEQQHGLAMTFRAHGELGAVPPDVALCLYRVTQEALGNVARHAAARHGYVTVERNGGNVALTVADDGRGFDIAEVRRRHGLGLISLDERVRLVGGRLTIDSQSERGTELRIVVPLVETGNAAHDRAAG